MKRLEPDVEREVRRLAEKGPRLREIGRILGCSRHAVTNHVATRATSAQPDSVEPVAGPVVDWRAQEIRVGS